MAVVAVGVDGSAQSLEALKLAAREAAWRSGTLRAVYVYEPVRPRQANRLDDEERAHARRHAEDLLRQIVASVEDDMPGVEIDRVAIGDRHPSEALLRAAVDADLLVVGSRGLGGFAGLLLGSIGQQCVQHATCPVLVVRPAPRPDADRQRQAARCAG